MAFEMFGPWLAERRMGGTPWHAHHIAERYSLLTIIALGEGVVGTVASLSAVVSAQGWSVAAVLVAVAGTGLTFGMWWVYFVVPQSQLLHARRELSFRWGYLHLVVFAAIVGNRRRVACRRLLRRAPLEAQRGGHRAVGRDTGGDLHRGGLPALHVVGADAGLRSTCYLLVLTAAVLVAAVFLVDRGMSMANALLIVMLAPAVTVVGYEVLGYRHAEEAIARRLAEDDAGKPTT